MKKFIKILVCMCLCVVSIAFVACKKETKIDAPQTNATVSSNGGIVVRKGNFLYFANGYESYKDVGKGDLNKSYNLGGLFVTKLNSKGEIDYTDKKQLDNMTKLSGKLASFEATELFISGDYMYFTSINTEKDKKGNLQTSHLEIYRIKLDSTDCKRVYRSYNDFEDSDGNRTLTINYFENNGNVYILINDNGSLKRIVCGGSIGDVDVVKSNVKSMTAGNSDSIFYSNVNDSLYEISRYDIVSNKVTSKLMFSKNDVVNSLFEAKFDNLYIKASLSGGSEYLYRISFADFDSNTLNLQKLTATSYTAIYLLENELDGILLLSSSKAEIADSNSPLDNITLQGNFNTSATIMMVSGGYVYYYADKTISRWNYTTDTTETIATDVENILNYHFDMVDSYIYFYATTGSNAYLYRVNVADRSPENVPQIVGRYNDADAPATEEEK